MASPETAAEVLRREGAVAADDVLRWLADACQRLSVMRDAGVESTVTLDSLKVSRAPGMSVELTAVPLPAGAADVGRAQVRDLAALGYELLKGLPPPATITDDAWVGLRPELKAVLGPALAGTGAPSPSELGLQLRKLGRAETAGYAVKVADTQVSDKPPAATQPSRVGEIFGVWELLEVLGSGGMGDVYRARHVRLGREAAVKVLRDELAAMPDVVQRFFQEARVVNEINHPHIVQIFDFVEEPRRVYCVMELLQGRSLAQLAHEDGPLPLRRTCRLLAQACDALQAAHDRGVVHRDVKPDNLFVTLGADGRELLKVLDFGVARRLSGEGARTQHGLVLGTPYYMAPEQAAGRAVDARADVYALGVALFELISGRDFSTVDRPGPLTTSAAGEAVPLPLTELIASCLSLDPDRRPASAAAVRAVLSSIADAPPPPRPTTEAIQAAAGLSPRRVPTRALLVAGLAMLLAGVWWWGSSTSMTADGAAAPPATTTAGENRPAAAPPPSLPELPATEPSPDASTPGESGAQPSVARKPPTAPVGKKPPKKTEPPPPEDPLAGRVREAQRRYGRLIERHGAAQLTSIERAAIGALMEEARAGSAVKQATLQGAESALDDAERRLER
ncbi:MAG: serine/threonine-protein kinase [Myxococcota bacterium]